MTPEQIRCLASTLDRFGRFFEELRLIADAPLGDPLIIPDLTVGDPIGSPLFLRPLYLSARSADSSGVVIGYNVHLKLENMVAIIDQYDYSEMLLSVLHQSISMLYELECQFYQAVSGSRKDIVEKYREIFDFDAMNYQNTACVRELSDKLGNVAEDCELSLLDLSWAWRYYRPGRGDGKVAHMRSYFCECGGAVTLDRPPEPGAAAIRCPLCRKVLASLETVH